MGLADATNVPVPLTTSHVPVPPTEGAFAASVVLLALDGRDWFGPAAAAVTVVTVTATVEKATLQALGPVDVHVIVTVVPACAAAGVNTAVGEVVLLIEPAPKPLHTPPVADPPKDAAIVATPVWQIV